MSDSDENGEVTVLEAVEGKDVQADEGAPLVDTLDQMLSALDFHRLAFLYSARAIRAEEIVSFPESGEEALAGEGDDYLLQLRDKLDLYAQRMLREFGRTIGQRPRTLTANGGADIEGGSSPCWDIDAPAAVYLERASDRIFTACRQVAAADVSGGFSAVLDGVLGIIHDKGQSAWSAARRIRWEYLEDLDSAICAVKEAAVRARYATGARLRRGKNSQERRFKFWGDFGDACFIVDGQQVKFYHEGKLANLRLRVDTQAHTMVLLLLDQKEGIPSRDVRRLSKRQIKSYAMIRNVNTLLNQRIRDAGFTTIPENDVAFIYCRRTLARYCTHIPVMSKSDFDRREIRDSIG
jgi:hypothetical protein